MTMTIFENKKHFLHHHLTFLESVGKEGRNESFEKFLFELGIDVSNNSWDDDHSTINWQNIENHYQFFFDYEGNEGEIKEWLRDSELQKHEFLYTWLAAEDPIIKVRTIDFIENWYEFNIAGGGEGIVLTTTNGELFLELTDDWKHHLNSNFEIKSGTKKVKGSAADT